MSTTKRLPVTSYTPVEPICDEHICPVTNELLVDPYQSSCCGNYFSEGAVAGLLAQKAPCPICRAVPLRCVPDKAFKRNVHQALKVRCLLHNACNWAGSFNDFLQHCGIKYADVHDTKRIPAIVNRDVKEFSMEKFDGYFRDKTYYTSPPFYTHSKGYKMCIRVYPYGYDEGEGTHLCIAVYLMNGDYDDRLQFPFRGAVTVQIVNQILNVDDQNFERTYEFNDQTDDTICMRVPESETMNSGFAMYNFIPLNQLQNAKETCQYLKNDCLKFKIAKVVVKSCSEEQTQYEVKHSSILQGLGYIH